MNKKLVPITPEARGQKMADLIGFLEEGDYAYVPTEHGFIVSVKELELVPDSGIIAPKKSGIIT